MIKAAIIIYLVLGAIMLFLGREEVINQWDEYDAIRAYCWMPKIVYRLFLVGIVLVCGPILYVWVVLRKLN